MLKHISLFILLSEISLIGFSQQYSFDKLTSEEGLLNPNITSIIQDKEGFMWFGTSDGLLRFDGYSFNEYKFRVNGNVNEGYGITNLLLINDTLILIGRPHSGIYLFNKNREKFLFYNHDEKNAESIVDASVICSHIDKKNNIWLGTRNGLERFDFTKNKFEHFRPFKDSLAVNYISGITEDSKGTLWLFCSGTKQFVSFNPENQQFNYFDYTQNLFKDISYSGGKIICDKNDRLWIGSEYEGLFSYNIKSKKLTRFTNIVTKSNLSISSLYLAKLNNQNILCIGTNGGGLYFHNIDNDEHIHFSTKSERSPLLSDAVYSLFQDKSGSLWIGYFAAGINIYKPNKQKFDLLSVNSIPSRKLPHKSVLSCANTFDKKIILGTDGGGFVLYNPKTRVIEKAFPGQTNKYPKVAKSVLITSNNTILIGSWSEGLFEYSKDYELINHFSLNNPNPKNRLSIPNIWTMEEDIDGNIWLGSLGGGVEIYSPKTHTFRYKILDTENESYVNNIFKIFRDSKNRIWVANGGHGTFVFESGKYDTPTHFKPREKNQSIPTEIRDIFEDTEGGIWFASSVGGLYKLIDFERHIFKQYTTSDNLPSNKLFSINSCKAGKLWIGSNNGLFMFDPDKDTVVTYELSDGIQDIEYNKGAALLDSLGNLYFGGINGINIFNPKNLPFNNTPPPVVLISLNIYNQRIETLNEYNNRVYLKKPLYLTDTVVFTHNDHMFQIEFSALDYTAPKKNKYRYMLEGFDQQWTNTNYLQRYATYTNLQQGTYKFIVQACNNDGVWNNEGASVTIIILPPWWATWWTKLFSTLFLFGLAVFSFLYRINKIKKQKKELEIEVKKRTIELNTANDTLLLQNNQLELQNTFILEQKNEIICKNEELEEQKKQLEDLNNTKDKLFSLVAHDIKNPLGVVLGFQELLHEKYDSINDEKKKMYFEHIYAGTKTLNDLILNLLDWSKAQAKSIKTNIVKVSVEAIIADVIQLTLEQANTKNIVLENESEPESYVYADYQMLHTIIRNIITNSLKFTPEGGRVSLLSKMTEVVCEISICDTGIGMTQELQENIFKSNHSSTKGTNNETGIGLGLLICKEFTELQHGTIRVSSVEGEGSCFTVSLPIKQVSNDLSFSHHVTSPNTIKNAMKKIDMAHNTDDLNLDFAKFGIIRILIVDDNKYLRTSLFNFLSQYFVVEESVDGKDAMDKLTEFKPHFIISDLTMPNMNGIELCKAIRSNEMFKQIWFILLTAESLMSYQVDAYLSGINCYMMKPLQKKLILSYLYSRLELSFNHSLEDFQ